MKLLSEEQRIKDRLDAYVAGKPFRYNPDEDTVRRVIQGLAKREAKTGKAYCPCRMVTGNAEADSKIVCPCAYHEQEIREDGFCYCRLFVAEDSTGKETT